MYDLGNWHVVFLQEIVVIRLEIGSRYWRPIVPGNCLIMVSSETLPSLSVWNASGSAFSFSATKPTNMGGCLVTV